MPRLTQSYVHGTGSTPLIGETIGRCLDLTAARWPDREGIVARHQNIRWSWAELKRKADDFAAGLLALGLRRGERIGIWSANNAEWVVVQFAAAKAGLILVTINPAYQAAEVEYVLNKAACRALVMAAGFRSSIYLQILHELAPELATSAPGQLHADRLPSLNSLITISFTASGCYCFEEIFAMGGTSGHAERAALSQAIQFDDPVCIMFTSGTTGMPKGVTLSHHNLINAAFRLGEESHLSERDRLCAQVPMFHIFGYAGATLACLIHGAAVIFTSLWFDPLASLQAIEAERCTAVYGVPTMFIAELSHPEFNNFDLTSLRTGLVGGSPCPIEIMKRCVENMHLTEICCGFGMTEAALVFMTACDDTLERRTGTVGRILPHMEAKIIDADGRVTAIGEPGELCVRGYVVTQGYWEEPERTHEAIDAAGWLHTGDMAAINADGYCNITGRIKDLIIRGGENISPGEIEEFLYRFDRIAEVQVFGVPDEKYGEVVCAWIRLKPGESTTADEIQSFCEGQIARYKIPHVIRFVDSFPTTASGKVQKFAMRDMMISELGLRVPKTA